MMPSFLTCTTRSKLLGTLPAPDPECPLSGGTQYGPEAARGCGFGGPGMGSRRGRLTGSHHELLVLGVPAVLHAGGGWKGLGRDSGRGRAAAPPPPAPSQPRPCCCLTTRNQRRARGRGRRQGGGAGGGPRRRLPPPAPPPLRAAAEGWPPPPGRRPRLLRFPGGCPPVRPSGLRRGPASVRLVALGAPSPRPGARGLGSSSTALQRAPVRPRGSRDRHAASRWGREHPLPARLSVCLSDSASPGRRLAALCFHGRCVHRGCGLVSLAWCLHRVSNDRAGKELALCPGCPPECAGEHLCHLGCVTEEPASQCTSLANQT